jgi:hypothetical protein
MKEIPPHIKEKIDKLKDELKKVYELAEESWEGCDGCDENDKHFWMNGFRTGYNRAKPDVLSDEQLKNILHTSGNYDIPYHKDSIMSYGKICEHDDGYLCEHRRQYIIGLFEKKEISDEEALRLAKEMNKQPMTSVPYEISDEEIEKASYGFWQFNEHTQSTCWKMGAKWYREQLKQRK